MKAVTIDNLDIKEHVRWAQDQVRLDPTYSKESPLVAPHHPEILWTTGINTSKWEELFDWQQGSLPWAAFTPPHKYHLVSKRLFSYRLFPQIYWEEKDEEEEPEEEEKTETEQEASSTKGPNLRKQVIGQEKFPHQPGVHFEKDKTAILNLLDVIKFLNTLLGQINARKLQYQKG